MGNKIALKIIKTKMTFCKKVLNSKNSMEIWRKIYRISNAVTTTIKGNVNEINFFNNTAERVTRKSSTTFSSIKVFIKSPPENSTTEQFMLE